MKGRILIADDDEAMCRMLEAGLGHRGFAVAWDTHAESAFEKMHEEEFDVVLTDLQMPGVDGIELCRRLTELRPDVPVVVITAFGSMESAVAALRAGAYDFVNKPIEIDTLALVLERAVGHRRLLEQVKLLRRAAETPHRIDDLVGNSPAMQSVYDLIRRLADTDVSVLIHGESGTGKELAARALHHLSARRDGQFVALNCAAVPEALLESELFGHVRGAFTDARDARDGLLVQAHGGTLLLDEIADMPVALQPKLLRALEERTIRPVGSNREIPFDVRLIASTHQDIESLVAEGGFREDLYYRLNVVEIRMPPLRARDNDVLLLAQRFTEQFASASGKAVKGIATPVANRLLAYPWPGNVRELRNCMERAVALSQHDTLVVEDLPPRVRDYSDPHPVVASYDPMALVTMNEIERRYIQQVLRAVGGNRSLAARTLGFDRKTLYRKLEKYGIDPDSFESSQ